MMRTADRPAGKPEALVSLSESGGGDFKPLAEPLHTAFHGACTYCERRTNDGDVEPPTKFFTCDHFKPRHLLCHRDPSVGACSNDPSRHSSNCLIYDWDNLVYACRSCADVKGGQWPRHGESAIAYISPNCDPDDTASPDSVFSFDLSNGRIIVHPKVNGITRNNAQRTIDDLALNDRRGPRNERTKYASKERKENLAELRSQWVKRLRETIQEIAKNEPRALPFVINECTQPGSRFSSICRQYIQESEYRIYLTPPAQPAAQS